MWNWLKKRMSKISIFACMVYDDIYEDVIAYMVVVLRDVMPEPISYLKNDPPDDSAVAIWQSSIDMQTYLFLIF